MSMPHYKTEGIGKGIEIITDVATPVEEIARAVIRQDGMQARTLTPARLGDRSAVAICDRVLDGEWTPEWDRHLAFLVVYEGRLDDPLHGTATKFQVYGPRVDNYLRARVQSDLSHQPIGR